jgi:hypothetical protein
VHAHILARSTEANMRQECLLLGVPARVGDQPRQMGIRHLIWVASNNRYEDSVLPSGAFVGTVEETMDCTCALYLNDISAWRLRRLDVPRLRGSHHPVGPTGMAADTVGQPGNPCPTPRCQSVPPIQEPPGTMS